MHELHFTQPPKDSGPRRKSSETQQPDVSEQSTVVKPDSTAIGSQDITNKYQETRLSESADAGADTINPPEFFEQETVPPRGVDQIELQIERPDGKFGEPFDPDHFIPEAEIANWIPVSDIPRMKKGGTAKERQEKIFGYLPRKISGPENMIAIPRFVNISTAVGGELKMVKYKVTDVVGEGGMGQVVRAEPVSPSGELAKDESVVVKLTFDKGDKRNRQRTLREVGLQAVLHPDPVNQPDMARHVRVTGRGGRPAKTIKDLPTYKGATYFPYPEGNLYATVYEHIPGTSLDKYSVGIEGGEAESSLTPADTVQMMLPVANALSESHALGIINRDVKPGNMIGSPDRPEETRLIDLGLGKDQARELYEEDYASLTLSGEGLQNLMKETDASPLLTEEGDVSGTPIYMDLEAFSANPDHISDVHAFALSALHVMDAITFNPVKKVAHIMFDLMQTGSCHKELDLDSIPVRKRFQSAAERGMIQDLYKAARPRFPEGLRDLRRKMARLDAGGDAEEFTSTEIRELKGYIISKKTEGLSDVDRKVIKLAESLAGKPAGSVELTGQQERFISDFLAQDHFDRYMPLDIELRGMDAVKERMAKGTLARYKELGEEPSPRMMAEINRALGVVEEAEEAPVEEIEKPAAAVA